MRSLIQKGNIYALPILHYNMETASITRQVFMELNPDCVAVELPKTMELQMLHAASRLPDISVVVAETRGSPPLYYPVEPCDAAFEALRSGLEAQVATHCIDLDLEEEYKIEELVPDPYAIFRIGHRRYYETYKKYATPSNSQDQKRELHMAWCLKGLSLSYDKVFFVGGMAHIENVLKLVDNNQFPAFQPARRDSITLATLTEKSCREALCECGFFSTHYESSRQHGSTLAPNRQLLIYQLYKEAAINYTKATGNRFPHYHIANLMKFSRNYALFKGQLMPSLYQILTSAKGCVDHNYAYEAWLLATSYPYLRNVDNLPVLDLSVEEIWGQSKIIRFEMKEPSRKKNRFEKRRKDRSHISFKPPGPFGFCSHQPEDAIIENFSFFLQSKGTQILSEEGARTIPFTTSLEDGLDAKETIRHFYEHKLYVKVFGRPPGGVGSVVVIFNEDKEDQERYPWKMTWHGEHQQESDMAFYATSITNNVVGPGISRCEYGGFMMSYPPRRMWDIWQDPDYEQCRTKAETLLMAAIDYAVKPLIVYVAETPPRRALKHFASRFNKKIVYIPIGQLSPITLNKIRTFHVLDGHDKRSIADEYIY